MEQEEITNSEELNEGGETEGLSISSEESKEEENNTEEEKVDEKADEEVAPETYDFTNVTKDTDIELDKELTDEFSAAAKELNLSQAKADKFMGMAVKLTEKFKNAVIEAKDNQLKTYATMLNNDKEIGGAKLKQSLLDANVAYKEFVSEEAAALLAESGLNKHPAIVKVFMKIGKQLKDDTVIQSGSASKERTADDWYRDTTGKQ